ncbi:MAG: hypothetical protein RL033_7209, partial [Pseudomonadota bacterium]
MCDRGVTLLGKSALLGSGGVAALAVLLAACAEVPLELAVLPTFVPVPDCIPYVERIQHL